MEANPQAVLKEVFLRVIEDYAFLFSDDIEEDAIPATPGPYLQAAMGFNGPFPGRLELTAPRPFAREVAANVLGLDVEDEQADASALDSLKELLNITCGNLLTALVGETPVFDLTIPEITPIDEDAWKQAVADAASDDAASAASDWCPYLVGDWPVLLRLTLDTRNQEERTETP
jgi:hypothetical protein